MLCGRTGGRRDSVCMRRTHSSLGDDVFSLRSLYQCGAALALWAGLGTVGSHVLAQEQDVCPPPCQRPFSGCLRSAWARMVPLEPYRPFDDHFPRFHPVPTNPVFPSLYEPNSAGAGVVRSERTPRERIPRSPPPQPGITSPVIPEVVPTPPPKPSGPPVPKSSSGPREAVRPSSTSTAWIFLPAAVPESKGDRHPRRGQEQEMASESGRVLR